MGDAGIWSQAAAKLTNETVIEFLRQLVAEIPWGHNLLILNMLTIPAARLYGDGPFRSLKPSQQVVMDFPVTDIP